MINNIFNRRTTTSLLKFTYQKYQNNTIKNNMSNSSNSSLLQKVREYFNTLNIDAFIIGSGDAHQSEYVHQCDMRRAFISNFHGSAGTALITKDKALLWTDGRYFLQATNELSEEWTLMKSGEPQVLEINDWIKENLSEGSSVGVDAYLMTALQAKTLQTLITPKKIELKSVSFNPIDAVWENRPDPPKGMVEIHDIRLAGISLENKIKNIQNQLDKDNVDAIIFSMLDEIMWALNIRGCDVNFNPVAISYLLVDKKIAHLFIDSDKISSVVKHYFGDLVKIHPYENIENFLIEASRNDNDYKINCDLNQLNWKLQLAAGNDNVVSKISSITLQKSIKNDAELNGIRKAHIRDGVALTAFFHWLESTMAANKDTDATINEYDVTEKIEEFRSQMPDHKGPSFGSISGYGTNGAIIHYHCDKDTCQTLGYDSLFLLDSGGQYLDGTTDVTRMMHFGEPTQRMKDCYTLVLKGHIALGKSIFPEGTIGSRLDCLARLPLWNAGLDFNHGTGHGVGAYLNVHEGPQGIGFRLRPNDAGFTAGMTTSNEPGYYEEGNFGIRIENVCICTNAVTANNFNNRKFCTFETVTMTPIKTHLINISMLDDTEIEWLNNYHEKVRKSLVGMMTEYFPESVSYLNKETQPITRQ